MILSFNPIINGDKFIWINQWIDNSLKEEIKKAKVVILPQTISRPVYIFIRSFCEYVFPNYDTRFEYEGKLGDIMLFLKHDMPHPDTVLFPNIVSFSGNHKEVGKPPYSLSPFPFVIKTNKGDEGSGTWIIKDKGEFDRVIEIIRHEERQGRYGFLIQRYVPDLTKTLRVTVIGDYIKAYWKSIDAASDFYTNIARGGEVDFYSAPELMEKGIKIIKEFTRLAKINMAGFDLCFEEDDPLFLEINYTFGLKGLGGADEFYKIFRREATNFALYHAV